MALVDWRPLILLSEYKSMESSYDCCAVSILQLADAYDIAQDIRLEVEGATALLLMVPLPKALTETQTRLHTVLDGLGLPKVNYSAPTIGKFFDVLCALHPNRDGTHESTARIPPPFLVKPDPKRLLCAYEVTVPKMLIMQMVGPKGYFAKKNMLTTLVARSCAATTTEAC